MRFLVSVLCPCLDVMLWGLILVIFGPTMYAGNPAVWLYKKTQVKGLISKRKRKTYFWVYVATPQLVPLTCGVCTRRLDGVALHTDVVNDVGASFLLLARMVIRSSFGTKSYFTQSKDDFVIRLLHQLPPPIAFYKYVDPDTSSPHESKKTNH